MSRLPYPLSDNWNDARPQIEELLRILYEERIGGLKASDSLDAGNDVLSLFVGSANSHLLTNAAANGTEYSVPYKIGTLTREMDADSGSVSYTGVGFKPSTAIFICFVASGISVGIDNGALSFSVYHYGTTPTYGNSSTFSVIAVEDTGKYQGASILSLDSDGFTLSWTRVGVTAPGTTAVYYLALR